MYLFICRKRLVKFIPYNITVSSAVPRAGVGLVGGEGVVYYNGLNREALPERGTLSRFQVHEMEGVFLWLKDVKGKSVICFGDLFIL